MRIALTITELHPGGAEKCFANLACFLKDCGHEVCVWQLWPAPPDDRRIVTDQLDAAGIPWHSGNAWQIWDFPGVVRWLRKELTQFSPDIVQAFLFHANLASSIATRKLECPLFGGARVRQPEQWRQWLLAWSVRRMQRLVCVSQRVADDCQQRLSVPAEKLLVIPNGIDLATVPPPASSWATWRLPADARVLLFVGRLVAQKGILPFVEQIGPLLDALPEHHLVILGDGPLSETLAQLISASPHRHRLHLVGWDPQALAWMQLAELLVLPAQYEGMPNVVLEGMATGLPVASFDVDGVRELLGDGELAESQIAPAAQFSELNRTILRLCQDEHLRSGCAASNRTRVEEHFQLEKQLKRYLELYQRATGAQS